MTTRLLSTSQNPVKSSGQTMLFVESTDDVAVQKVLMNRDLKCVRKQASWTSAFLAMANNGIVRKSRIITL